MTNNKNSNIENEIPSWDLHDLYVNIDDIKINEDLKFIEEKTAEFVSNYENKIAKLSESELLKSIKIFEIINDKIGKISGYNYLIYSTNLANESILNFYQNINEKLNNFENKLVFFTIEINNIDEDKYKKLISSNLLKDYLPFLKNIRIFKPYQLSPEIEKILIQKNITSNQAFIRLFDETVSNLKFAYRNQILTSQEIFNLLSNIDDNVRKDAGLAIAKTFNDNIKIFAYITNILAKDKAIEDNYRGFKTPISSRNLNNFVEDEIVEIMIENVKANYQAISHRYYKIKAKILNKDYLNFYDRNAPLNTSQDTKISWIEAKNMVLEAYQEFSPKMHEVANKFFTNNWIDAKVVASKDSGAYSHPLVPSVHPYILMNFQGKIRDVMTLAHELGHGVHQYISRHHGVLMYQTPLTLAETASVFGEQLVFQKILKNEKDVNQKKFIIANKVEDMINTVIRQIAFLEFEKKIHDNRKNGEIPLEKINKFWLEVQENSLGSIFKFDESYQHFWCYIPHFIHSPFYVYAYAFGECLVNSLYGIYQQKHIENFQDKYLQMLENTAIKHHKELLLPFGLDISDKNFWQAGLNVIIKYIDELEDLTK